MIIKSTKLKAIALGLALLVSSCAFGDEKSNFEKVIELEKLGYTKSEIFKILDIKIEENKKIEAKIVDKNDKDIKEKQINEISKKDTNKTDYSFTANSLDNSFKIGYEYRSVEKTLHQGSVRLELSSYFIPYAVDDVHINTNFMLIDKDDTSELNSTVNPKGEKQSLTMSVNLIKPFHTLENIKLFDKTYDGFLGLIGEYSFTKFAKTDENSGDSGVQEYFVGLRSAVNRKVYADIMYGRSETHGKNRVKFRGETNIKDSSWSIGGEYLLATEDRANNKDFMKVYISKDFNFENIFK
jgi:hypothetical protein